MIIKHSIESAGSKRLFNVQTRFVPFNHLQLLVWDGILYPGNSRPDRAAERGINNFRDP